MCKKETGTKASSIPAASKWFVVALFFAAAEAKTDEAPPQEHGLVQHEFGLIDSDCDVLRDQEEIGTASMAADSDGDGLPDVVESRFMDSDGDGTIDQSDPDHAVAVGCHGFFPVALVANSDEAASFSIDIRGAQPQAVKLANSYDCCVSLLRADGQTVSPDGLDLYDDGTHGDTQARDGRWTRGGITVSDPYPQRVYPQDAFFDHLEVSLSTSTVAIALPQFVEIYSVHPEAIDRVIQYAPNVYAVSNVINIVDPGHLWALRAAMLGEDYSGLRPLSSDVLSIYPDMFEMLGFFLPSPTPGAPAGLHLRVGNDVAGIGIPIWNGSQEYGSAGQLRSLFMIKFLTGGPVLHEIMHRWGVSLDSSLHLGSSHWRSGVGRGVLGGWDTTYPTDNGDGTYSTSAGGTFDLFNRWELYLAGLIAPEDVPNAWAPENYQFIDYNNGVTTFAADFIHQVAIEDVVALEGPREPSYQESPPWTRIAFVFVSEHPLTSAELAIVNDQALNYSGVQLGAITNSFEEATGYRGQLRTEVSDCDQPVSRVLDYAVSESLEVVACEEIVAVEGSSVLETGDVYLRAGRRVVLHSGFAVHAGGSIAIVTGPFVPP